MARISYGERGHSYWRLVWRYSLSSNVCANGLAKQILRRYLRVTRFTCLDRRESIDRLNGLIGRLRQRHPVTYHFDDIIYALRCDGDELWIGGMMVAVDTKKRSSLKRLHKVIQRVDADQARKRS